MLNLVGFIFVFILVSPVFFGLLWGLIKGGPPNLASESRVLEIDPASFDFLSVKAHDKYEKMFSSPELEKAREGKELKDWHDFLRSTENGQNSNYPKK